MKSKKALLCWHSTNHGIEVLENALNAFSKNNVNINRVYYLVQSKLQGIPQKLQDADIYKIEIQLENPTYHTPIYQSIIELVIPKIKAIENLQINISPGTPAMHAVWLILYAGGYFTPDVELWSSQYNPQSGNTTIDKVDFSKNTYMAQINELVSLEPDMAVYKVEAKSPARKETMDKLARYSRVSGAPLLILGERGTGKTRLVETYVKTLKQRDKVVTVTCGGLDSSLSDSTMFGHVKGAFTGATVDRKGLLAEADNGILFLDEIQDLPREIQRKLVRVFQDRLRRYRQIGSNEEKRLDIELVCASNIKLNELRKRLDHDLFDRISHLVIEIPPLRECKEDIIEDWKNVWKEIRSDEHLPVEAPITPELVQQLKIHQLPGNLRDLQRLALLIMAWWNNYSSEQAVNSGLKEWISIESSLENRENKFGIGTRKNRINWFKGKLANYSKDKFGTWVEAAKVLSCDEKTLRDDGQKYN